MTTTMISDFMEQCIIFGASDYHRYGDTVDKDNWHTHVIDTEMQTLLELLVKYYDQKNQLLELPYSINRLLNELYPLYAELENANYHTLNRLLDTYYAITHDGQPRPNDEN